MYMYITDTDHKITSHITHTSHAKQAIEEQDLGIRIVRPYTIEEAGQEVIFLNLTSSSPINQYSFSSSSSFFSSSFFSFLTSPLSPLLSSPHPHPHPCPRPLPPHHHHHPLPSHHSSSSSRK